MLYLLVGFAVVMALGTWLTGPSEATVANAAGSAHVLAVPTRGFSTEWSLVFVAWATSIIIRPRWLCMLMSILVVVPGVALVAFAGESANVDSPLLPDDTTAMTLVKIGWLLLLSRAATAALLSRSKRA